MPLFMLISGYLFFFSINQSTWEIIKGKFKRIIIPLISWHTIFQLTSIAMGSTITPYIFFLSYFHTLWFLRAVFYSCLLILFVNRFFNDNIGIYITIFTIMLFLPNRYFPDVIVYTMPYFCIGFLFNKIGGINTIKNKIPSIMNFIFSICSILFFVMLYFFENNYYVYVSKTFLFNKEYTFYFMLFVNIYRHLTAIFGCIVILWSIWNVTSYIKCSLFSKTIIKLSQASLCIYIINHYLNETILIHLPIKNINIFYISLETICIILLSYFTARLLKTTKTTRLLFLGGR